MKLLYITNQICGSGGLERVLAIKTKFLIDNYCHDIHIITLNQESDSNFFDFSNKIRTHNITANGSLFARAKSYISGLKSLVNNIKPDIVLVCDDGLKGFFIPTILQKPCPIIYERHVSRNIMLNENDAIFKTIKTNFYFLLMQILAKNFDKFVVLTDDNVLEWNTKNIDVIPNPLTFYPDEKSSLTNKTVIAVGKQSYQKGYDRLLQSWKIVHKKNPDWILKIFGKFDESQGLVKLTENLKLSSSVQFFNEDKNIVERFLESSIFVLSSRYEGFGMVIIEAMACGLPAISFDCPCGPKEIISKNKDGFLIENGNIRAFASAINELIADENLRLQLGTNARENVKRFTAEIVMPQWQKLFNDLHINKNKRQ